MGQGWKDRPSSLTYKVTFLITIMCDQECFFRIPSQKPSQCALTDFHQNRGQNNCAQHLCERLLARCKQICNFNHEIQCCSPATINFGPKSFERDSPIMTGLNKSLRIAYKLNNTTPLCKPPFGGSIYMHCKQVWIGKGFFHF